MARARPARAGTRPRARARATATKRGATTRAVTKRSTRSLRTRAAPPAAAEKTQTRWRKFDWDDELTEDVRQRYEETNESIASIAAAVEMSASQLRRKIEQHGWRRPAPVKRGLSPAAKLQRQAEALLDATVPAGPPPLTRADLRPAAEALLRTAQAHAAELELLQRQASAAGVKPRDTHSLTTSIATMTATIGRLAQLCAPDSERSFSNDGNDIDRERDELARRIDALVDEWLHAAAADGASGHQGEAGE